MLGVVPSSPSVPDAVSARLSLFMERMRAEAVEYGPDAGALIEAAAATLVGGKRLRARFCHSGWQAVARFGDRTPSRPSPSGTCAPRSRSSSPRPSSTTT